MPAPSRLPRVGGRARPARRRPPRTDGATTACSPVFPVVRPRAVLLHPVPCRVPGPSALYRALVVHMRRHARARGRGHTLPRVLLAGTQLVVWACHLTNDSSKPRVADSPQAAVPSASACAFVLSSRPAKHSSSHGLTFRGADSSAFTNAPPSCVRFCFLARIKKGPHIHAGCALTGRALPMPTCT